jgi:hypothetical protein
VSVAFVATPVAPEAGDGEAGADGGVAVVAVVNDQTEPAVEPAALRAVTCQKYVVPATMPVGV